MTDEVANIVLEQLRLMRSEMADMRRDIARLEANFEARLQHLADQVRELQQAVRGLTFFTATLMGRVEAIETRMDRFESRT